MQDKLQGVQVLRAIAALTVVIYHAQLILIRFPKDGFSIPFFFEHGAVGVPVFFVVSGFIISHVILRPTFRPAGFLRRRFWRLWPLYAVCTLGYATIYFMQRNLPPAEIGQTFDALARALTFWPQEPFPILHPGWSLEHEVIFYLLAAVITEFLGFRVFFGAMVALSAVSLWWWTLGPAAWDWHLLAMEHGYFALGMATYLIWREGPPTFRYAGYLAGAGAVFIVAGCYWAANFGLTRSDEWPVLITAGPGSALLIYGLLSVSSENPVWKAGIWIGDRSYSLYLSHFMLVPVFQTIHRDLIKWPDWMAGPLCAAFVLASIALMVVVFNIFERTTARGFQLSENAKPAA